MIVWIDAARAAAERVFGLSLLERHLKALRHRKVMPSDVVVDFGDSGRPDPAEARDKWPFPVRIARGAGGIKARIAAACGTAPVLAVDIDTLADARLYDFLAQQPGAVAAEENGAVLVPGKPDESPLLQRCLLPLDHDDHMPPDGKPQPTAEELAALRAWIAAGAPF